MSIAAQEYPNIRSMHKHSRSQEPAQHCALSARQAHLPREKRTRARVSVQRSTDERRPADDPGCFKLYRLRKESWRRAVATWYKLKEQDSKKELLRACFGCTYARRADGELLACPLLEGLAVESQRLQARLCEQHPDLLKCAQESGKPRLEASVLQYILFEVNC